MKAVNGGNKYYRRSRISEGQFRSLVSHFANDLSATASSQLTGLTRKSVTTIFLKIRRRLARECKRQSPLLTGKIELTEGHACLSCVCGRRGCGTANGKPVFGVLCYENKIHAEIIPDCKKAPLRAIIRGRSVDKAVLRNNGWHGLDGLIDAEYKQPFKVVQADELKGINLRVIDDFWSFSRTRLGKFNGVSNRTFYLHLKECEWRFNLRERDLYSELLELLGSRPL